MAFDWKMGRRWIDCKWCKHQQTMDPQTIAVKTTTTMATAARSKGNQAYSPIPTYIGKAPMFGFDIKPHRGAVISDAI